ncbi:MAG: helix-turn-helix domain-containing protein [Acidimicrobiia bacterium]|nr:helix-turn-helix domain-containing protein [Acidimicrobiia bacterium]
MTRSGTPIQSIERAAQVLGLFVDGRSDLDLNEITRRLGFSRATAHRYCLSLRSVGLLRYEPETGLYGLGARVIELGTVALQSLPLVNIAAPYLHRLVAQTDRTAVMTVWDGQAPVIVRVNDNTSALVRISVRAGSRLPLFRSAQGHLYLAYSPSIVKQVDDEDELAKFESVLKRLREEGFSLRADVTAGIRAIAVPLFRREEIVATFALVGTEGTMPDNIEDPKVAELVAIGQEFSTELTEQT